MEHVNFCTLLLEGRGYQRKLKNAVFGELCAAVAKKAAKAGLMTEGTQMEALCKRLSQSDGRSRVNVYVPQIEGLLRVLRKQTTAISATLAMGDEANVTYAREMYRAYVVRAKRCGEHAFIGKVQEFLVALGNRRFDDVLESQLASVRSLMERYKQLSAARFKEYTELKRLDRSVDLRAEMYDLEGLICAQMGVLDAADGGNRCEDMYRLVSRYREDFVYRPKANGKSSGGDDGNG